MRSLFIIHPQDHEARTGWDRTPRAERPEHRLAAFGYHIIATARSGSDLEASVRQADAVILHMPLGQVAAWSGKLTELRSLPLLWWCSPAAAAASAAFCEDELAVDGVLAPSMGETELHWALHLGAKQFMARQQWAQERTELLSRLEERKWIDMAKSILCKMNEITEAEAYDMLRKRAMNDRKRIVDVATAIVQAHQILKA